jgi:two-component system response regulator MprA
MFPPLVSSAPCRWATQKINRETTFMGVGEHTRSRRAVILVVERDPHVRELEAYFLQEAGFEVAFARDGHEALEMAREARPELIITEVLVPGMDGLALCRTIKADPELAATSVLVFSILAASVRAHEAGADAFLRKPLGEQTLLRTVRDLLSRAKECG